jgi:hypothetical protein
MDCADDTIEEGASGDGIRNKLGIADQKRSPPPSCNFLRRLTSCKRTPVARDDGGASWLYELR